MVITIYLFQQQNYLKKTYFVAHGGSEVRREVSLTLKHGVEAKNYDDVLLCQSLRLKYRLFFI